MKKQHIQRKPLTPQEKKTFGDMLEDLIGTRGAYILDEKLNILVSNEELQKRLDAWEAPQMKTEKGYLSIYSKMAKSADKGAALNYN